MVEQTADGVEYYSAEEVNELVKASGITLDSLIGLDLFKKVAATLKAYLHKDLSTLPKMIKIPKNLLLYGPPGTGKTNAIMAFANFLGLPLLVVTGGTLESGFKGGSRNKIKRLFALAEEKGPIILFLDEFETIAFSRTMFPDRSSEGLTQMLVEMDGIKSKVNSDKSIKLIIVGATNVREHIDPALLRPGRMDRHIKFDEPNLKQIISYYTVAVESLTNRDVIDIPTVSRVSQGCTYADLNAIINYVFIEANYSNSMITNNDFIIAISHIRHGQSNSEENPVQREDSIIRSHHLAGHLLGFMFCPGLVLLGSLYSSDCSPSIKKTGIMTITDILVHLLSIDVARVADKNSPKGSSSIYLDSDIHERDVLLEQLFNLLGAKESGVKNLENAKRNATKVVYAFAESVFTAHSKIFNALLKHIKSKGIITASEYIKILATNKVTLKANAEGLNKMLAALLKAVGIAQVPPNVVVEEPNAEGATITKAQNLQSES